MDKMEETKKQPKIKKTKKIQEPKKPSRSKTPPKKANDAHAWYNWYADEIRERLANGQTIDEIKSDLKITYAEKFLNEKR